MTIQEFIALKDQIKPDDAEIYIHITDAIPSVSSTVQLSVILHYPYVKVISYDHQNNPTDVYMEIEDLVVIANFKVIDDEVVSLLNTKGLCYTPTKEQLAMNMVHPHVSSFNTSGANFCMGNTPLARVYNELQSGGLNEDRIFNYFYLLDFLVHQESLAGGPYKYISNYVDLKSDWEESLNAGFLDEETLEILWDESGYHVRHLPEESPSYSFNPIQVLGRLNEEQIKAFINDFNDLEDSISIHAKTSIENYINRGYSEEFVYDILRDLQEVEPIMDTVIDLLSRASDQNIEVVNESTTDLVFFNNANQEVIDYFPFFAGLVNTDSGRRQLNHIQGSPLSQAKAAVEAMHNAMITLNGENLIKFSSKDLDDALGSSDTGLPSHIILTYKHKYYEQAKLLKSIYDYRNKVAVEGFEEKVESYSFAAGA